ncbi:MAG: helix-turn-helix domain-containing protein [Myxococcales bacterium]|nr:helix-turn-helix domain-containing protein [Myxococcales bacterium]MCB9580068.1 helix-turn-helix domain-containing protein [Polyangiaceae bacterium]
MTPTATPVVRVNHAPVTPEWVSCCGADRTLDDLLEAKAAGLPISEAQLEQVLSATKDDARRARGLLELARLLAGRGRAASALACYQRAATVARSEGLAALAVHADVRAETKRAQLSLPIHGLGRASREASELGDRRLIALVRDCEAEIYCHQQRPLATLRAAKQALVEYEAIGAVAEAAAVLCGVSLAYVELDALDQADLWLEQLLAELPESEVRTRAYGVFGAARVHMARARWDDASTTLTTSAALAQAAADSYLHAHISYWEGELRLAELRYGQASVCFRRAARLAAELGDFELAALARAAAAIGDQLDGDAEGASALMRAALPPATASLPTLGVLRLRKAQLELLEAGREIAELGETAAQWLGPEGRPLARSSASFRFASNLVVARPNRAVAASLLRVAQDFGSVCMDGNTATINGPKLRALLAALCQQRLEAPAAWLSYDELADALWGKERISRSSRDNRLRVLVSRLRQLALGSELQGSAQGFRLAPTRVLIVG